MNEQVIKGRRNRRRMRLVSPSFQWRYAGILGLSVAVTTTLSSLLVFLKLHHQARMRILQPEDSVVDVTLVLVCFSVGLSLLVGALAAGGSILLTHRICGPLFVLGRYFEQLKRGRLPHVRSLRRADEFNDLLASFRSAMESLGSRELAIAQCLDGVIQDMEHLHQGTADRATTLTALRAKVENARRSLLGEPDTRSDSVDSHSAAVSCAHTPKLQQITSDLLHA